MVIVGEARDWLPAMHRPRPASISTATTPEAILPSPLALGAPRIRMDHTAGGVPDPPFTTLYADARGAAVVTARLGQGRVVFWASALPVTNAAIDEAGHVELVINAIGPPLDRRVIWDERYHGHSRSAWSYTEGTPLPAAVTQLALLGLAAVLTVSFRRRPLRAVPDPPRTAPLEFIDTMGGLYERAGAATTAVGVALAHLRRRLIGVAGLPADADDTRVAKAAAAHAGLSPRSLAPSSSAPAMRARADTPSPRATPSRWCASSRTRREVSNATRAVQPRRDDPLRRRHSHVERPRRRHRARPP